MKNPLLSAVAVALVAFSAAGCTNTGSVIGSVSTEQDKRPVRDAIVTMTPAGSTKAYKSQADWGGNYNMHVKEGEYQIAAEHPGLEVCGDAPRTVQVIGNKVATVDLCLKKPEAMPTVAPAATDTPADPAAQPGTGPTAEPTTEPTTEPTSEPTNPDSAPPANPDSSSSLESESAPLAEASTVPSQFPPSAAPTFPPAPVNQAPAQ